MKSRRLLSCFLALTITPLTFGADSKDEKKDGKSSPRPSSPGSFAPNGTYTAEVAKVNAGKEPSITVKVVYYTPGRRVRGRPGRPQRHEKDVTVHFAADPEIRSKELAPKGKAADGTPLQYTVAEMRVLKGNPKYPGWARTLTDVHPGDTVELHLVRDSKKPNADLDDSFIEFLLIVKENHKDKQSEKKTN